MRFSPYVLLFDIRIGTQASEGLLWMSADLSACESAHFCGSFVSTGLNLNAAFAQLDEPAVLAYVFGSTMENALFRSLFGMICFIVLLALPTVLFVSSAYPSIPDEETRIVPASLSHATAR